MKPRLLVPLLLSAIVGFGLRVARLDIRPMHNDEAVNGIKFGLLWNHQGYKYDPNEHHGPTLYYAALGLGRLTGGPKFDDYTEARLRFATVLFGVGLVLLLPLIRDGLGPRGTLWATVFTALSPAFVFYSRYFIHEMLLVFFTFLALAAGWRYWRTRKLFWIVLAGAGLGLMAATKETFVVTLAAAGIAVGLNQTWNRLIDASGLPVKAPALNLRHLAAGAGVCLAVLILFFSSFFTNSAGLLDALRTYEPWLSRAAGASPHVHPWAFYLHRLLWFHVALGPVWTEGLLFVLAIIGTVAAFRRTWLDGASASFVRFLAFYAFLLTAFYSLLAYKTPWCLLNFWQPILLLGGFGASVLFTYARTIGAKAVWAALLFAGAAHLGWQAWQANTTYCADRRNPYVYAQTSPEVLKLVEKVKALSTVLPQPDLMLIKVICPEDDYWPLPWYLRRFKQIGWWGPQWDAAKRKWEGAPADPYGSVMIVAASLNANFDEAKTHVMNGIYALRPEVDLELYIELGLWRAYLEKHPPKRED